MTGCFICPIYDQGSDFEYGYEFVESAVRFHLTDSLYFVFSSEEQQNKFLDECKKRYAEIPHGMIFERNLSDCENPITIKKFYALSVLFQSFDYIAAVDCECIFVKGIPVGQMLENVWNAGTCFAANYSVQGADIVFACAKALGIEHNKHIIKETRKFNYTWWFNDIPVYRSADIKSFYEWMEKKHYFEVIYHEWNCFDYLVYGLWLIMEKEMNLKCFEYKDDISIIESLWEPEIRKKIEIEKAMGTHWTSRVKIQDNENENIYMQFHRDRRHTRFRQFFGRQYRYLKHKVKKSRRR